MRTITKILIQLLRRKTTDLITNGDIIEKAKKIMTYDDQELNNLEYDLV